MELFRQKIIRLEVLKLVKIGERPLKDVVRELLWVEGEMEKAKKVYNGYIDLKNDILFELKKTIGEKKE